jgi:uncharacterized protein YjbI with pentapeptide repeats
MFGPCKVEAMLMCWLKWDLWKTGIVIAGILLLLVLVIWIPVSAADAQEGALALTAPVTLTLQATPTEDATVTALNKEKLAQEVQQLKNQNETDLLGWLRTNSAILFSTLVVVIGGLIGLFRWFGDRRSERDKRDEEQQRWMKDREAEREKRAEERFQAAVEGLSSEREEAKIGAAILLRTFLQPGYEQFYTQTFDLVVAHLRLPRIPQPAEDAITALPNPSKGSYPTTLRQALITVFKESFPLARDEWIKSRKDKSFYLQSLDATGIQLDDAYLVGADLNQAWLRQAYLRNVDLRWAVLYNAYLRGAYLREAHLRGAYLHKADLRETDLSKALMSEADLREVRLWGADLSNADLSEAKLGGADLSNDTNLIADLSGADLSNADLSEAKLNGVNIEHALSLKGTNLRGVKGLTKEQLEACKAKGAIIDEDSRAIPPQPTILPPLPSHSTDG